MKQEQKQLKNISVAKGFNEVSSKDIYDKLLYRMEKIDMNLKRIRYHSLGLSLNMAKYVSIQNDGKGIDILDISNFSNDLANFVRFHEPEKIEFIPLAEKLSIIVLIYMRLYIPFEEQTFGTYCSLIGELLEDTYMFFQKILLKVKNEKVNSYITELSKNISFMMIHDFQTMFEMNCICYLTDIEDLTKREEFEKDSFIDNLPQILQEDIDNYLIDNNYNFI